MSHLPKNAEQSRGLGAQDCSANENQQLLPGEQVLLETQKLHQFEVNSKREGRNKLEGSECRLSRIFT